MVPSHQHVGKKGLGEKHTLPLKRFPWEVTDATFAHIYWLKQVSCLHPTLRISSNFQVVGGNNHPKCAGEENWEYYLGMVIPTLSFIPCFLHTRWSLVFTQPHSLLPQDLCLGWMGQLCSQLPGLTLDFLWETFAFASQSVPPIIL